MWLFPKDLLTKKGLNTYYKQMGLPYKAIGTIQDNSDILESYTGKTYFCFKVKKTNKSLIEKGLDKDNIFYVQQNNPKRFFKPSDCSLIGGMLLVKNKGSETSTIYNNGRWKTSRIGKPIQEDVLQGSFNCSEQILSFDFFKYGKKYSVLIQSDKYYDCTKNLTLIGNNIITYPNGKIKEVNDLKIKTVNTIDGEASFKTNFPLCYQDLAYVINGNYSINLKTLKLKAYNKDECMERLPKSLYYFTSFYDMHLVHTRTGNRFFLNQGLEYIDHFFPSHSFYLNIFPYIFNKEYTSEQLRYTNETLFGNLNHLGIVGDKRSITIKAHSKTLRGIEPGYLMQYKEPFKKNQNHDFKTVNAFLKELIRK